MASGLRSTRTQYRTVGATSLKPAFGSTTGAARPEWISNRAKTTPASAEPPRSNAVEGVQSAEKPMKKSPSDSGRKRKDKRHLRERRHGTGVVILPGGASQNDEAADEAKQTMDNTKMNESIGTEEFSPSPSEVSTSSTPGRSRLAHDDVDLDRQDKQDLIDRIEQLEKALEQKTKEVETLKSENQALLRVVNQVSSLKIK